jgi:hypothetical protein
MKKVVMILSCLLVSGCTNLNSKFDCPATPGVGCKRISDINESINQRKGASAVKAESAEHVVNSELDIYLKDEGASDDYQNFRKVTIKI